MNKGIDAGLLSDGAPQKGFVCTVCHKWHANLPLSYSMKVPWAVPDIPDSELEQRVVFTPDQCVVDQRDFYLRGRIPVPIIGRAEPFIWGVWAKVSQEDFIRSNELWKVQGREAEPPFPGWLSTPIYLYGDTLGLELRVRTQVVGRRPHFELVDATHPLAIEQRNGITMERVQEIAEEFLHPRATA